MKDIGNLKYNEQWFNFIWLKAQLHTLPAGLESFSLPASHRQRKNNPLCALCSSAVKNFYFLIHLGTLKVEPG